MDMPPIVVSALTGFVSGFLLSVPIGPINLTIINEGARRGFLFAGLIALGSTLMEVIYCAIAFTGFSSYFGNHFVKAAMELFSFAFMLFLGVKFLVVKSIPAHTKIEEKLEEKLHPHSAFMMGLVRTMGNPGILVFWIILAANFISREWVMPDLHCKTACIAGVGVGAGVWLVGLAWAVSLGHRKFGEKTLLKMERFSGLCLLGLAVAHGLHIAWKMTKDKM